MFKKLLILIPILSLFFFFLTVCPKIIYAADPLNLQIPIGNTAKVNFNSTTQPIADYISMIYKYAIGIVGILATVVMMYGGLLWIMAGGSQERVSNARSWIMASVTGLVLALTSYTILYTINPALVEFRITGVTPVTPTPTATASPQQILEYLYSECDGNPIGLVHRNDSNATSQCINQCSPRNMSSQSNYYNDGFSYCCICGVCDGSNDGIACGANETCQDRICLPCVSAGGWCDASPDDCCAGYHCDTVGINSCEPN